MAANRLIRYAGWEPPTLNNRKIPVERAEQLRAKGLSWKQVAYELTLEYDRDLPFTADGVQAAVSKVRKKNAGYV